MLDGRSGKDKAHTPVGDFSPIGVNVLGSLEGFDTVGWMPVKVSVLQKNLCQLCVEVRFRTLGGRK